jgi:large subunit ribosomal protein L6
VQPVNDSQRSRAAWGMQRTNVLNLVTGVTEGFTKVLEITGVGYRAAAQGKNLKLQLGYSHDVNYAIPEGIDVKTPDPNTVEISGIDKQKVGQVAAEIRRWRKPEPYKGKGIKYRGEFIFRKEWPSSPSSTVAGAACARRCVPAPPASLACRCTVRVGTSMPR